jgi:hypothetical protein
MGLVALVLLGSAGMSGPASADFAWPWGWPRAERVAPPHVRAKPALIRTSAVPAPRPREVACRWGCGSYLIVGVGF